MDADGLQIVTEIDPAIAALRAEATGDVGIAGDARADRHRRNAAADGLNDAAEFMAERDRRAGGEFAGEDMPVGAADAAGLDLDEQIVRARNGLGDLFHGKVSNGMQAYGLHGCSSKQECVMALCRP